MAALIAASFAMQQIVLQITDAAARGQRVVILGPTGVGKELLARRYHESSPRRNGPFVALNCAVLDRLLLYAQLFGAKRGSFTGAMADLPGIIDASDGGTLFLDELSELPKDAQAALLRFLDTQGEYHRLGDPRVRHATCQIVCASNTTLNEESVRAGRFRDDLWFRLAATVLVVSPLCQRTEDIAACLRLRSPAGSTRSFEASLSFGARELLLRDPWPGNFRELLNFLDGLPLLSSEQQYTEAHVRALRSQGRRSDEFRGVRSGHETASHLSARRRNPLLPLVPESSAAPIDWQGMMRTAVAAFLADQQSPPTSWHQMNELIEQYIKPCFVGQRIRQLHGPTDPSALNFSALARQLGIADGKTVKTQWTRYRERFTREP